MGRTTTTVRIHRDSSIETAQFTVGVSEVEVAVTGETREITITADIENEDNLYLGNTGVTTSDGDVLFPGQSVTLFNFKDETPIYLISGTAGQKAYVLSIIK